MVLLDAYAAKTCARRVHNEWDPTIPTIEWGAAGRGTAADRPGREFERDVLDRMAATLPPGEYVDLRGAGRSEAIAGTLDAMAASVPVVIGGWLPDDEAGGRKGGRTCWCAPATATARAR